VLPLILASGLATMRKILSEMLAVKRWRDLYFTPENAAVE